MPSSKDVARYVGVSVATVSRVYSCPDLVKPETRERVLAAAKELNYYPNISARNLKSQKSNAIGIVVRDFSNPFFFRVIEKIDRELSDTDYHLMIFSTSGNFFSNEKLYRYVNSNQLDAFIFSSDYLDKDDELFFKSVRPYCLQLYSDCYESLDSITIDDRYGTYLAVMHLLRQGHRKILLITGDRESSYHLNIRIEGYIQAYKELNLEPDLKYNLNFSPKQNNANAISEAIRALKPTAIITHSDIFSILTLSVLQTMGLKYPKDISLIMYDDSTWANIMNITAIAQPIDFIGKVITNQILNALSHNVPRPLTKKSIKPDLISRGSVRPLR